ncbi:MAG: hypothetical protein U9M98_02980 [Patescibacteria group bacterium]|nr:hypothetical protein [Patescibacteria group bacterium]
MEEQSIEKSENYESFSAHEKGEDDVLLDWEASERPFKQRDKSWFTTVAVIVVLVSFVALFLREFILLGVVFAITFVSYLLSTKEPQTLHHKITVDGVSFSGTLYPWKDLDEFWFRDLGGERVLVVTLKRGFPGQLIMLLGETDEHRIKNVLAKHLKFVTEPPTDWMERSAHWLSDKTGLS